MLFALLIIFTGLIIADYLWKKRINTIWKIIPGPWSMPIIGSVWMYLGTKPEELLELSYKIFEKYGRVVKFWIFHLNALFISDTKYIQALLNSTTETKKNRMYSLLDQWLGEGLLISHGPKWLTRRRAITPAFHFQILENFIHIFDQQAIICAAKFDRHLEDKRTDLAEISGKHLDIEHYIGLATLDVICETAMGVKINAQTDEGCEYVQNLIEMQQIFLERFVSVAYRSQIVLKLFNPKLYTRYQKVLKTLHRFTENIIQDRKKEMLRNRQKSSTNSKIEEGRNESEESTASVYGYKKRMALLDILLCSSINGEPLSDSDIREEVDTFMFEGHDTTKSAIGFTLYLLSRNPEVQQKLYEELKEVLNVNVNVPLTYNKLMELKYMEKVIKESLRMYPPVPFIGRQIMQDFYIEGQCIPKGTSILLGIMTMQNDPAYFPNPHKFLPDRETHTNAFTFIPFSAGPRNCIGQRFALLEMKTFLARILQAYELLPMGAEVKPCVSLVLKSETGWQMGFRRRETKHEEDTIK